MINIFIGEISEFNRHNIDNILSKYRTPLIYKRRKLDDIEKTISSIKKPIIKTRSLLYIDYSSDENRIRLYDFNSLLTTLDKYKEHNYLDLLIVIDSISGLKDYLYTTHNIKLLNKTFRSDMFNYILNKIQTKYNYTEDVAKALASLICKRLRYSSKNYEMYKDVLFNDELTYEKVTETLNLDISVNLYDITIGLLSRKNKSLRNYYKACERYSKKWVNKKIKEILSSVISNKIKYFNNEITLQNILSDSKKRRIKDLILYTNISDCYHFYLLFSQTQYAVEDYFHND